LPGYAFISALFPAKKDLNGIERIALSFGLSLAVVHLIALGLNYTPCGIKFLPILVSVSVFILIVCYLAYYRRNRFSENETFSVPFNISFLNLKTNKLEKAEKRRKTISTVTLIISILASIRSLMYVMMIPKEGEHFTEFYILGPKDMADNYPKQYTLVDSETVIVGILDTSSGKYIIDWK